MQRSLSQQPVGSIRGVGKQVAARLEKLGIETLQDLVFHLPARYQDRTRVVPVGRLFHSMQAVVEVSVLRADVHLGRRRALLVQVADDSGALLLRFFYFSAAQQASLHSGARLRCFGEVRRGPQSLEMVHPEYELLDAGQSPLAATHLTPIYPLTEGISQPRMRAFVEQALAQLEEGDGLSEYLPDSALEKVATAMGARRLPSLKQALLFLHKPPADADLSALLDGRHPAQQRLAFEELLAHRLALRLMRERSGQQRGISIKASGELVARLVKGLPFSLTAAQTRVSEELIADMAGDSPMQRLLQGDVGSGKTLVAAIAALRVVEAGYQAALMAPTEILAEQHGQNFARWLEPLEVKVCFLVGKQKAAQRRAALEAIASGEASLVIGTQALFQSGVDFHDLALVVVDEQHRFGVQQRLELREKGINNGRYPHQLMMTATPIPRSLAMTAYADLDISVIDELPPGRTPVTTVVLNTTRREEVIARIKAACSAGRQVYWVCTLIEDSEVLEAQAAEDAAALLAEAMPSVRVGLVHGRLKPEDKGLVMQRFKAGELDLLVATTVIEVGVDVPNASLMIIENAERLGLAQLHQLRGRVGRGSTASACVLLYQGPLSQSARARLAVMRETTDGFRIAQEDLRIRGPGEVLGTRQTGELGFKLADVTRDADLLPLVRDLAKQWLAQRSAKPSSEWDDRIEHLIARWIGKARVYGEV